MKPVRLPAEAQRQLDTFRDVQAQAEKLLAGFERELGAVRAEAEREMARVRETAQAMIDDRVAAADLVADAWADYEMAVAAASAQVLEIKSRPAQGAADVVRKQGRELAKLRREVKHTRHLVALCEWHFPWLADLREDDELRAFLGVVTEPQQPTAEGTAKDPVEHWLTEDEFRSLSTTERNQRALDRYLKSRKTPWQLGRDYEMYIGHLREARGGLVTYQGILAGFDDLGRDLLVRDGDRIEVIQCKRWAQHKTIHEKHVFQLFGTVVAARIEHPRQEVTGTFVTTTSLSDRARRFAAELDITIEEQVPLGEFPRIKCNVSRTTSERIYHLPFDQQYDTTVIEPGREECWAFTVAEAEEAGFRRAWRWRGSDDA